MVRKIKKEDKDIFLTLGNQFYNPSAVTSKISNNTILKTFKHIIKDGPYIKGYLIIDNLEVAGFFTISFGFGTEYGGNILLFEDLYIKEKFQNKGIGSQIFKYIEKTYKNEVEVIKLEVAKTNKRAIELYNNLGYFENKYLSMLKVF